MSGLLRLSNRGYARNAVALEVFGSLAPWDYAIRAFVILHCTRQDHLWMRHFVDVCENIRPFRIATTQGDGAAMIAILKTFDRCDPKPVRPIQRGKPVKKGLARAAFVFGQLLAASALNADQQFRLLRAFGFRIHSFTGPIPSGTRGRIAERDRYSVPPPIPAHPVRLQAHRAGRSPGSRIWGVRPAAAHPSQRRPVALSGLFRSRSRGRLCLTV